MSDFDGFEPAVFFLLQTIRQVNHRRCGFPRLRRNKKKGRKRKASGPGINFSVKTDYGSKWGCVVKVLNVQVGALPTVAQA
jgi:hypothetical protein